MQQKNQAIPNKISRSPYTTHQTTTTTNQKKKYKFCGHQTFTFRHGWIEKGVQGLLETPDVFFRAEAITLLGVGKNMVESIRHWCTVMQIMENANIKGKKNTIQLTTIGKKLLSPEGWDPYLEKKASLWLLHWLLVSNPIICTTWQIIFAFFQSPNFTRDRLIEYVYDFAKKNGVQVSKSSIVRDISCFMRTYTSKKAAIQNIMQEKMLSCPLQELGLIQYVPDTASYRFSIESKQTLPSAVFGYALMQYWDVHQPESNTMDIQDCLYGVGSPGQVFKLDENSLLAYIEELDKLTRGKLTLDKNAGRNQIKRREIDTIQLLENFYTKKAKK